MKKNPIVVIGALVVILAGAYWAYTNKKILSLKGKSDEVNVLFLPRYRYVDNPSNLNINKGFDPNPVIKKLEEALSTDKVKFKVKFDADYPLKKDNFSDLKNTVVFGNPTFFYRMIKRNGMLEPMLTYSANAVNECTEDGIIVTLKETPFTSLQDAKGKSIMAEGIEGAPHFALNSTARELAAGTQDIFSEVSYSVEREVLMKALEEKKVDMLFLNTYAIANEGAYSSYGKLIEDTKILGHDNLKIVYKTKVAIPCGFVMSSGDILPADLSVFGEKINGFVMDNNNKDFLDKAVGIKSFYPVKPETWQRAYEYMVANDVDSPIGKLVASKTKKSSEK